MSTQAPIIEYVDFVLRIQREEADYRALVVESPDGQADSRFAPAAFDAAYLELFDAMAAGAVDLEPAVEELGRALFAAVFTGGVLDLWRASQARSDGMGKGLRLRLRLTDVPEVARWPWETLYDPLIERFLALSSASAIVRNLEAPGAVAPLAVPPPLQLLVVAASPSDLPALAVDRELAMLEEALAPLRADGRLAVDVLTPPTLAALQNRLRQGPVHLLHFIGHGDFVEERGEGSLAFEQEDGATRTVTERQLSNLLSDHRALRLVVLNACEGGRNDLEDAFGGVAQALMRRRVPAVLAMAHPISDDAALALSGQFYAALADRYPVEAALAEARKAAYNTGNVLEWATPVLHLRSADGRLFAPLVAAADAVAPAPEAGREAAQNTGTVVLDIDNSTIDSSSFNINVGGPRRDEE
jgi:hypothetical protein